MLLEMCRLTAAGIPPAEAARTAMAHAGRSTPQPPLAFQLPAADDPAVDGQVAEPACASRSGSGLPLGSVRQECRGLARAAVRLDAVAVQEQLTAAIHVHGLVVAWEEILAPALQAVGRKWQSAGERYVEVEHLLSWHISATLRHVYVRGASAQKGARSSPVVLACVPGEQHTLPLEALNATLTERGVPTLMLGGAVPSEALLAVVRRVGPAAVALWSQSAATASTPLVQHLMETHWGVRGARMRSQVLLCGPGWKRTRIPGPPRPRGLHEALRVLGALDLSTPA
jgi:methanogenic corrinoid protein MtbC1